MTTCLIIGGAGMLGQGLARALAERGALAGAALSRMTLYDVVGASQPRGDVEVVEIATGDLSAPGEAERLVAAQPDVIYHLAAIVSGEAERDFEKGYRINLDGTRHLFEAIRAEHLRSGYRPRVVFASSLAVFGGLLPDVVGDGQILSPMTSYGTQKAIGELLLADYSRRGFFDGIGLRLPTICVRPGKPNAAASGFFSSILREPLAGQNAVLPVSPGVRAWLASPRAAIGYLLHAGEIDTSSLDGRRNLTMPGLSVTVGEQIEALRAVAGEVAVARIRHEPDSAIEAIVSSWPKAFDTRQALALGFRPDESLAAIIAAHIEDQAVEAAQ